MRIREEIENCSDEKDIDCLLWLFTKWPMQSEWFSGILVTMTPVRYGTLSYEVHHVWTPTKAGKILFENRDKL